MGDTKKSLEESYKNDCLNQKGLRYYIRMLKDEIRDLRREIDKSKIIALQKK